MRLVAGGIPICTWRTTPSGNYVIHVISYPGAGLDRWDHPTQRGLSRAYYVIPYPRAGINWTGGITPRQGVCHQLTSQLRNTRTTTNHTRLFMPVHLGGHAPIRPAYCWVTDLTDHPPITSRRPPLRSVADGIPTCTWRTTPSGNYLNSYPRAGINWTGGIIPLKGVCHQLTS